jgi:hypothetical protein
MSAAVWEVPRFRPFVLLVKATCRWRWPFSNGEMVLTEGTPKDSEKDFSQCHFVHREFHIPVMLVFITLILYKPNIRTRATKGITVAINTIHQSIKRRSQWPRGLRRRSAAARLLRLWVRIPHEAWMSVTCECCQVEVSTTGWSLVQRSPNDCGTSWCVI